MIALVHIASGTMTLCVAALGAMAMGKMALGAMITGRMAMHGTGWAGWSWEGRLGLDCLVCNAGRLGYDDIGAVATGRMAQVGQLG